MRICKNIIIWLEAQYISNYLFELKSLYQNSYLNPYNLLSKSIFSKFWKKKLSTSTELKLAKNFNYVVVFCVLCRCSFCSTWLCLRFCNRKGIRGTGRRSGITYFVELFVSPKGNLSSLGSQPRNGHWSRPGTIRKSYVNILRALQVWNVYKFDMFERLTFE